MERKGSMLVAVGGALSLVANYYMTNFRAVVLLVSGTLMLGGAILIGNSILVDHH